MKKIFTLLAAAMLSATAFAQVNNSIVSHTPDDEEAKWTINLLGVGTVNADECSVKFKRDPEHFGSPGLYFGLSNLTNSAIELKPANSLEFGITPFDYIWWNSRRTVGIIASVGVSWTRYAFKHREAIVECRPSGRSLSLGRMFDVVEMPDDYSRLRLTYASWRLPLEVAFSSGESLFTVGLEAELRHHLRMRSKFDGNKKHYITSHDLGINPWGLNAVASIGRHGVSVFGRVSLTQFFNKDEYLCDIKGTPFLIGIRFYHDCH
ncbi:MAG: hypothetical protein Q4B58_02990 [Bacteroidales bacterium]|nr:hypothetical protein [Bacteroidales bacterium]